MNLNDKTKRNFYIMLAAVGLFGSLYWFLFDIVDKKQSGDLFSAMSRLNELGASQSNFSAYEKLLRDTEEERLKLGTFVVRKNSIADFIENIEMLAKHANVEINKTLSVEKNPQKPKENIVRFSIRSKGTFRDVYYFSLLMENIPYKIRVKKLALATSGGEIISDALSVAGKEKTPVKEEAWTGEIGFELLSYINE